MKWLIFIITHGPIIKAYYESDVLFSAENYAFFNVAEQKISGPADYQVINRTDLPHFRPLGKKYAEGEAIYNIYKSGLYRDYDYVGFIHYDHELIDSRSGRYDITAQIKGILEQGRLDEKEFIAFSGLNFIADYNQEIMMDERYPDKLTGHGRNCYLTIIQEYNEYFHQDVSVASLKGKRLGLCSAFMCSRRNFGELMGFLSFIIEKGYLNKFDRKNKHRFPGGMLERYIGIFFSRFKLIEVPLAHRSRPNFKRLVKYFIYHNFLRFFVSKKYELKA